MPKKLDKTKRYVLACAISEKRAGAYWQVFGSKADGLILKIGRALLFQTEHCLGLIVTVKSSACNRPNRGIDLRNTFGVCYLVEV